MAPRAHPAHGLAIPAMAAHSPSAGRAARQRRWLGARRRRRGRVDIGRWFGGFCGRRLRWWGGGPGGWRGRLAGKRVGHEILQSLHQRSGQAPVASDLALAPILAIPHALERPRGRGGMVDALGLGASGKLAIFAKLRVSQTAEFSHFSSQNDIKLPGARLVRWWGTKKVGNPRHFLNLLDDATTLWVQYQVRLRCQEALVADWH